MLDFRAPVDNSNLLLMRLPYENKRFHSFIHHFSLLRCSVSVFYSFHSRVLGSYACYIDSLTLRVNRNQSGEKYSQLASGVMS